MEAIAAFLSSKYYFSSKTTEVRYYGCTIHDTKEIGFRDELLYKFEKGGKCENKTEEMDREECLKLYGKYALMPDKIKY